MKATATLLEGDDRISVKTEATNDEFELAVEACREVGGGRWHKPSKSWRYPLSLDTCHRLRTVWGRKLEVATPLRDWYVEANALADQRSQASTVADASLARLPQAAPKLAATLRADQRVTAVWLAEGWQGSALLADHPGTGKTLGTISGVIESGDTGSMLVVCPRLSVKAVWFRELTKWTNETVYMARGTRKQREAAIWAFQRDASERKWLIIVAETLRIQEGIDENGKPTFAGYEYPQLFDIPWSWVVVDESHKLLGSLTVVKGNLAGKGLKRLDARRRLAVTGTPFGKGGRITGMFGTLHWLWPTEFTSFWRWAGIHFEVEEQQVSRTRVVKKIGKLRDGKDEEHFLRSLGPRMLRRTKAEVLPNLPDKRRVQVWCEPSPAQLRQQKHLLDDGEILGKNGIITVDGVLAYITRGKQVASGLLDVNNETVTFSPKDSCKIDTLMERLEQRGILDGSGDTKVIIASQFNELLRAVEANLEAAEVRFLKIVGSTSDAKRDAAMEEFQADQLDVRVMLLNSKAGGVSVTLDAADELHMLDEMWDPGDNEQLEDRIHRASRVHQATIYRYLTEGTIDEGIANDVEGRRFEQHRVLDASRDVAYVRALVEKATSKASE